MAEFIAYSTGTTGQGFRGKLTITETVNTAANTSDVTYTFVIWANFSTQYHFNSGNQVYVNINGSQVYGTADYGTVDLRGTSESNPKVLCSGTVSGIAHNSDGTKSISVSAQYIQPNASALYSINPSGTVTLTTIARASSITSMSNATVNSTGGSTTLTFTPLSNSFYYRITLTCGSWSNTTNVGGGYTAGTARTNAISIPVGIADYITNSKSATVTAVLHTYSSSSYGTLIGSSASKTFTVTLGTGFAPTVSISTDWYYDFESQHLCNRSTVRVSPSFTGSHGSTLSGYQYTIKDSNNNVVQSGSGSYWSSATFAAAGNYTITVTATDSRGNTGSETTAAFTLIEYNKPSFISYSASRGVLVDNVFTIDDTAGTYVRLSYALSASTNVTGNTITKQFMYSHDGDDSAWETLADSPAIVSSFPTENAYVFKLRVYDSVTGSYNATEVSITVSSAAYPIDFLPSGHGAAFGKVAQTEDELEVNWTLKANKNASVGGALSVGESAIIDGNMSVGGTEYLDAGIISRNFSSGLNSYNVYFLPYVSYHDIDPTHDTTTYFKALLKWICTHYPSVSHGMWIGIANPSSAAPCIIHIYDTGDTDSNGYPRYATGMWLQPYSANIFKFGFWSFEWYEGTNT